MESQNDLYLMHHGIKGMHWGVRRFEDANGHLTPEGKRRYAVQDARKYYKINRLQRAQEKTRDADKSERLSRRIRRVQTRSDRKHADLDQKDINTGRQIVAKNRRNWAAFNTVAKAGLTAAGAYALYQNPKTRALAPLAIAAGGAATLSSAKKLPYYTMEARRYKQVNPKGATQKGLTKKQKALRKVGKAAVIAGLAGAAGYVTIKSGGAQKAIDIGKGLLPFDKAVKVANAEEKVKNAFGIKTGRQKQKKQMGAEASNLNKQYNRPKYTSTKTDPSEATKAILDANQRYSTAKKVRNGTAKIRSNGRNRSMTGAERKLWNLTNSLNKGNIKKTVKDGVKSAIRKRVMNDVDTDDIRTWGKAIKNTKDLISNGKRYAQAVNAAKNRDAITAISSVTPEIIDNTNKLIEQGKNKISRNRRKSKLK